MYHDIVYIIIFGAEVTYEKYVWNMHNMDIGYVAG